MFKLAANSRKFFSVIGQRFCANSHSKISAITAPLAGEIQPQNPSDDDIKSIKPTSTIVRERLPLELECEIFACLKLPIQRKFISGLGMEIYEMCAPKIRALLKAKKLFNPAQNGWSINNMPRQITISPDRLTAINSPTSHAHSVFAMDAFPVASPKRCRLKLDNFPGTIIYYFEVKQITFQPDFCIGFDNADAWYTTCLLDISYSPSKGCECGWLIYTTYHSIKCFKGAIKPEWKWAAREGGNVAGCGLLLNSKNQLAIFGTLNGILLGSQRPFEKPIGLYRDQLYPTAYLESNASVEANFGTDTAKPFEYDIHKCPGLQNCRATFPVLFLFCIFASVLSLKVIYYGGTFGILNHLLMACFLLETLLSLPVLLTICNNSTFCDHRID